MIAADELIDSATGLQELPRLVFVRIRKVHTLETNADYHFTKISLSCLYFSIGLVPQGKSMAPHIACANSLLVYAIGLKETVRQCHMAHQWFGENLQISLMTAIFVIYCQLSQKIKTTLKICMLYWLSIQNCNEKC